MDFDRVTVDKDVALHQGQVDIESFGITRESSRQVGCRNARQTSLLLGYCLQVGRLVPSLCTCREYGRPSPVASQWRCSEGYAALSQVWLRWFSSNCTVCRAKQRARAARALLGSAHTPQPWQSNAQQVRAGAQKAEKNQLTSLLSPLSVLQGFWQKVRR